MQHCIYIPIEGNWQPDSVFFVRLHHHQICSYSCTRYNRHFSLVLCWKTQQFNYLHIFMNSFYLYYFITIHSKQVNKSKLISRIWVYGLLTVKTPSTVSETFLKPLFPVVLILPFHHCMLSLDLTLHTRRWEWKAHKIHMFHIMQWNLNLLQFSVTCLKAYGISSI